MISCQSGLPRAESKGWPLAVPKIGSGVSGSSRTMSLIRAIFDGWGDGPTVPSEVEGEASGEAVVWLELVELVGLGLAPGDGLGDGDGLGAKQVAPGFLMPPLLGPSLVFMVTTDQLPIPSSLLAPTSIVPLLSFNFGKVGVSCPPHSADQFP